MSYTQYIGRKIDVLAYRGARTSGPGDTLLSKAITATSDGGQITTGIQKLAQDFLLELLTIRGSKFCEPDRGCLFMQDAQQGLWRTTTDVFASFAAALVDVEANLLAAQDNDSQADEQFKEAEIEAVTLNQTSAAATVRVTSQAGTSRLVIAPLTTYS